MRGVLFKVDMDVERLEMIRRERRRRGWSMRAAAAAAGVSNTTWSRMESGAVDITPAMARHIADAFGWPDDWETDANLAASLSQPVATLNAEELLERIRAELAEHERRIAAMLERLQGVEPHDDDRERSGELVHEQHDESRNDQGARRPPTA